MDLSRRRQEREGSVGVCVCVRGFRGLLPDVCLARSDYPTHNKHILTHLNVFSEETGTTALYRDWTGWGRGGMSL